MAASRKSGLVRFRIKGKPTPPERPPLELHLRQDGDSVDVMLGSWFLIGFKLGGKLVRYASLPESLGLPLDEEGRVVFADE